MDTDNTSGIGSITPGSDDKKPSASHDNTGPIEPTIGVSSNRKPGRLQKRDKMQRKDRLTPKKGVKPSERERTPTPDLQTKDAARSTPSIEELGKQVEKLHAEPEVDEVDNVSKRMSATESKEAQPDQDLAGLAVLAVAEPEVDVVDKASKRISATENEEAQPGKDIAGLAVLAVIEEPVAKPEPSATTESIAPARTPSAPAATKPLKQTAIIKQRSSVFLTWAEYIFWGLIFMGGFAYLFMSQGRMPELNSSSFLAWSKPWQLATIAGAVLLFYVVWMHMFGRIWDALLSRISYGDRVNPDLLTHAIVSRDAVTIDAIRDVPRYRIGEPLMALLELLVIIAIVAAGWFYQEQLMATSIYQWLITLPEAAYAGVGLMTLLGFHLFIWGDLIAPFIDALFFRRFSKQQYLND